MKRTTLFLLFSCCIHYVLSQTYFFGDLQSRYQFDKVYFFESNNHTISKPYWISEKQDTLRQLGVWEYAESMDTMKVKILPIIGAKMNADLNPSTITNTLQFGAQINSQHQNGFSSQVRLGYQLGALSNYEILQIDKRPFAPGIGYLSDSSEKTYSKPLIEGVVNYQPNQYFIFSTGIGKQFLGDGYRSLWLSDYAPTFPFLKMESTFWKAKYVNLWTLHNDQHTQLFNQRKWSSLHLLSLNVTDWLNLSVFESIVWQGRDTLNNRGFDINYINPFVFYRPVEYGIGSADNSFMGAGVKFTFAKHYVLYGNIVLDEFLLSEVRDNRGWWGNKYGVQFGLKCFDLFGLEGLYAITEWNAVRPFTYSHMTSMQNYGHKNHSLAHPLEANFMEALTLIGFQKGNFDFLFQYHYQFFGKDFQNKNYGGDMFNSYNDRVNNNYAFGHTIGQGNTIDQQVINARLSWMLMPLTNTKIFTQFNYRYTLQRNNNVLRQSYLFNFGITSNLWQSYLDY